MSLPPDDAWDLISPSLTDKRRERLLQAVAKRTDKIALVIQDVHQPHNVSACFRSAEAFGVHNLHVVTLRTSFSPSTVARGVHHWVNVHRHSTVQDCAAALKREGYKIACALPRQDAVTLDEIDATNKIALVFGNEHSGIDPQWKEEADIFFTIPMVGLVESLNISVSAAISLYSVTQRAKKEKDYYLSPEAQKKLLNTWIEKQTPRLEERLELLRKR